jgi:MFS superfamily sulfate permease-like transporter
MSSVLLLLIGVPLNVGIALASGVSATAGLISGMIGGIVVGLLAGCPLMVTAPATGLIAAVVQILDRQGIERFGSVVMLAGLFQILIGRLNLAPWFRAVAPAVVQGMLAGIGVLIFASQFHVMLEQVPSKTGIVNLMAIPRVIYEAVSGSSDISHYAAVLGLTTIFCTVLWSRIPGRAKLIPGSLVGITVSVLIATIGRFTVHRVQIPDDLASELHLFQPQNFLHFLEPSVWGSALELTLIATAQTLLTATAIDRLHGGESTNYNRETIAQGTGNFVAGILGVLPMSGVMVRSSANVSSGSQTRWSTVLQGVWLSVFTVMFAAQMKLLPISSIAGVLVYAGYRLINVKAIKELSKFSKGEVANYWITLISIVCSDLLTGIMIGFAFSAARLVYVLTHCTAVYREDEVTGTAVVEIQGSATFFTLPALADALRKVPSKREVHVFVRGLNYIDHACLEHITTWEERYIRQGGQVFIEWDHLIGRFNLPLTREIAEKGAVQATLQEIGKTPPSDAYDEIVGRCNIIDLDQPLHYSEIVEMVADTLAPRLHSSGRRNLIRSLTHEFAESGPAVVSYAAIPNQCLYGLKQSELLILRSKSGIHLRPVDADESPIVYGLTFLVSPPSQVGQHLRLLSALASRLEETELEDWLALSGVEEIREFVSRHQRFVSLCVTSNSPTGEFAGKTVAEIGQTLPKNCLLMWLDRDGQGIVPKGNTLLKEGDRITILGNEDDISEITATYTT